jgi:hypothetical protein
MAEQKRDSEGERELFSGLRKKERRDASLPDKTEKERISLLLQTEGEKRREDCYFFFLSCCCSSKNSMNCYPDKKKRKKTSVREPERA